MLDAGTLAVRAVFRLISSPLSDCYWAAEYGRRRVRDRQQHISSIPDTQLRDLNDILVNTEPESAFLKIV